MPRYIDAEKFRLTIIGLREDALRNKQETQVWALNACECLLNQADTADVNEAKHGEWEEVNGVFFCTRCGDSSTSMTAYCRNCGAEMRLKRKDSGDEGN